MKDQLCILSTDIFKDQQSDIILVELASLNSDEGNGSYPRLGRTIKPKFVIFRYSFCTTQISYTCIETLCKQGLLIKILEDTLSCTPVSTTNRGVHPYAEAMTKYMYL